MKKRVNKQSVQNNRKQPSFNWGKSKVLWLGCVAILATIILSGICVSVLYSGNANTTSLAQLIKLSSYQYEINRLESGSLKSEESIDEIINKLEQMQESLAATKVSFFDSYRDDISKLNDIVAVCLEHYEEIKDYAKERGYVSGEGLYSQYGRYNQEIYTALEEVEVTKAWQDGKWINVNEWVTEVSIDGSTYYHYIYDGEVPQAGKRNMLVTRVGGNGIESAGNLYINNICLYKGSTCTQIDLSQYQPSDFLYSFGAYTDLMMEELNGVHSIVAVTNYKFGADQSWGDVSIQIPLKEIDIREYDRVTFEVYMPEYSGDLMVGVALDGKYSFKDRIMSLDSEIGTYTEHYTEGSEIENYGLQLEARFEELLYEVEVYYNDNPSGEETISYLNEKYDIFKQMRAIDQEIYALGKENNELFRELFDEIDIVRTAIEEKVNNGLYQYQAIVGTCTLVITILLLLLTFFLNRSMRKSVYAQNELQVAKAVNEAKDVFLSNVSHEIRTPINAILGLNEITLRDSKEAKTRENAVGINNAGKMLLSLVNDILDISKLDAEKMELIPIEYGISSVVTDLVTMVESRVEKKNLQFFVNVDKNLPSVLHGDEIRIKQCASNILTNAVKYTEKGSVTMNVGYRKVDEEQIYLCVSVTDTGIGIKKEDLKKLFAPFERIEVERIRNIEGTGLGLNIVQKLLKMMNSKLQVESEYGKGSTFSFEILQRVVQWEPIGDYNRSYKEAREHSLEEREVFFAPEAKVLFVDDTAMNLTVIKGLLAPTEIQVDTAESGREALEYVQRRKYDMIFLDYRMPGMDGIETLNAMKQLENNENLSTPCIAFTANAISGAREKYLSEGFENYLTKPVDSLKLEKMLLAYLPQEKIKRKQASGGEAVSEQKLTLKDVEGVDYKEALKNCVNEELLMEVVEEFFRTISEKAEEIQSYADGRDYENYAIQVHALKSSARLIGAIELSEMAAELEQAGNKADETVVVTKTPEVLEVYRSYEKKLRPLVEK